MKTRSRSRSSVGLASRPEANSGEPDPSVPESPDQAREPFQSIRRDAMTALRDPMPAHQRDRVHTIVGRRDAMTR